MDVAGRVEAVVKQVTRFQPGHDYSVGATVPAPSKPPLARTIFAPKPTTLTFEQAAAIPISGWVPQGAARGGKIQRKVLIIGAGAGSWPARKNSTTTARANSVIRIRQPTLALPQRAHETFLRHESSDRQSATGGVNLLCSDRQLEVSRGVVEPIGDIWWEGAGAVDGT
jgi:hypothetical protein